MNRIFMLLAIIGLPLAANTATAGEVDINVSLGHSPAYANAGYYYPQQTYAPVYRPAYQAEQHYQPAYAPAYVVVAPHHEYRPQRREHGSRGYGGGGHHSRGRDH